MAKGFKFPAPKGFAKGGMCSPKGAKAYAKGGYAEGGKMRSESTEYERARRDLQNNKPVTIMDDWVGAFDKAKAENNASRDAARESLKNKMRATGGYAKGGKVKKYANGGPAVGPGARAAAPAPMPQLGRGVPSLPDRPTAPQQLGRGVPSLPDRPTAPQQLGRGLPSLPDRPTAPLSAAAQGRSTGLPPPKTVPGPVTGTAISPTPPRPITGDPKARPVPGPVTGTALSPAQPRRSTGLPEPDLSKVGSGVGTIMPQRPASGAGNTLAGTGRFANGGKVTMKKMKGARKFLKTGYADGGEVETEQMASKSTRVKMPRGGKTQMSRAKSVPVNNQQPMIQPRGPSMMGASPLARVANTAPSMGMKMGGKAKKH